MSNIKEQLWQASSNYRERNDCAVKALAAVTGCGYEAAHAALKERGRKDRGRTSVWASDKSLDDMGYGQFDVTSSMHRRGGKTVRTLERVIPEGKYLVGTRGHVFAILHGDVVDWTKGRRHHIVSVRRIYKKSK